jgi:hypothetical protein
LTLLVAGVGADHSEHAAALHDFALVADFLDTRTNLHGVSLLELPDDLPSVRVTTRDLDCHPMPGDEPDYRVTRQIRDACRDHLPAVESNAKERVREYLFDDAVDLCLLGRAYLRG